MFCLGPITNVVVLFFVVILIFFLHFYESTPYVHVVEIVRNNVAFSGIRYVFAVGTVNMDLHNKPVGIEN